MYSVSKHLISIYQISFKWPQILTAPRKRSKFYVYVFNFSSVEKPFKIWCSCFYLFRKHLLLRSPSCTIFNCVKRIVFAPNANAILADFTIHVKCGLITENKTCIKLFFFKFLWHINRELFALSLVIYLYDLNGLQLVGFNFQVFSGHTELSLEEAGFPNLLFSWTFWGFAGMFHEPTQSSDGPPDPFALHRQLSSSNFLCHV